MTGTSQAHHGSVGLSFSNLKIYGSSFNSVLSTAFTQPQPSINLKPILLTKNVAKAPTPAYPSHTIGPYLTSVVPSGYIQSSSSSSCALQEISRSRPNLIYHTQHLQHSTTMSLLPSVQPALANTTTSQPGLQTTSTLRAMQKLPLELREMIWEFSLPEVRVSPLRTSHPIPMIKAAVPGAAVVQIC